MKKLISLVLALVMVLALSGCGSAVGYTTKSQATEAYNVGDYETVISLLKETGATDDETAKMLCISEAQVAYGSKDYMTVVALLSDTAYKSEVEIYSKSLTKAVEEAVSSLDAKTVLSLYEMDEEVATSAYTLITDKCSAFEYGAFGLLDDVVSELPECVFSDELIDYAKQNKKTRIKAFMQGDWEWINEALGDYDATAEENATVPRNVVTIEVFENDEDCVGILKQISPSYEAFLYQVGDVYWYNFVFKNDTPATVVNMTRYDDGYGTREYTLSPIQFNMEVGQMNIHVTDASSADRIWQKIS